MNNPQSNVIRDIVNKIPPIILYNEIPDRKQALNIINWLYQNVPESRNVDQQVFFREVIGKHLRVIGLKVIEIHILIVIGLNYITLEDFSIDGGQLVKKLLEQNKDMNDLDTMYRATGQIMSKMPRDLRDSITGEQKLKIFQELSKGMSIEPKLLEKFLSIDPSLNTPITMEVDAGDYNTLNKKYQSEMKKFEESYPYINSNSLEYTTLKKRVDDLSSMAGGSAISGGEDGVNINNQLKTQYIDMNPTLMVGADKKLYYYDESSGTISEMPTNGTQIPVTIDELETVLKGNKVKKEDIDNLIMELKGIAPKPTVPEPVITGTATPTGGFFKQVGSVFTSWFGTPSTQTNTTVNSGSASNLNPMELKMQLLESTYEPRPTQAPEITLQPPATTQATATTNQETATTQPPATTQATATTQPPATTQATATTTRAQISAFTNMGDTTITKAKLIENMKKNNKNVENVALGLVVVFILIFIVVMYNAIRDSKK